VSLEVRARFYNFQPPTPIPTLVPQTPHRQNVHISLTPVCGYGV